MGEWKGTSLRDDLHRTGYCTISDIFTPPQVDAMRSAIDRHWARAGRPVPNGRGIGIHPLIDRLPEFAEYLLHPRLMASLDEVLGGRARLMRSGARLSDDRSDSVLAHWHNHYHWNRALLSRRQDVGRVLAVIYLDGAGDRRPSRFAARPRRLNDSLGFAPAAEMTTAEPQLAPGDVLVFDSALWHAAFRGPAAGIRRIAGGHYQAEHVTTPHPDNDVPVPAGGAACR